MKEALLSIDIGSASLRSALVTPQGKILKIAIEPIKIWKRLERMEQSSDDIYESLIKSVRHLLTNAEAFEIRGIGVDATASMVLLDKKLQPLYPPENPEANILGWMDHRAQKQSEYINKYYSDFSEINVSKQTPEMNLSKILWLKQEQPELWNQCGCLMDLYDYITWRLTGVITRTQYSMSTTIPDNILKELQISPETRFQGVRLPAASAIPGGLCAEAAKDLGLSIKTPVSTAVVDGYGGSLAVLTPSENDKDKLSRQLSMVVGTSTIYIASSKMAEKVDGCWGPVPSVFSGYSHIITGQTAAGALIDFIIDSHPASEQAKRMTDKKGLTIYQYLNQLLISRGQNYPWDTQGMHILPYFAGNRCPRMDMTLTGIMTGLTLDNSTDSLALSYLCVIQSIALGARHNIERLLQNGFTFDCLKATGGLAKNPLFVQEHVNAIGIQAVLPREPDAMLLAGAITASVASGVYDDIPSAMQAINHPGETIFPEERLRSFYDRKYDVFLELYKDQQKYKNMMTQSTQTSSFNC